MILRARQEFTLFFFLILLLISLGWAHKIFFEWKNANYFYIYLHFLPSNLLVILSKLPPNFLFHSLNVEVSQRFLSVCLACSLYILIVICSCLEHSTYNTVFTLNSRSLQLSKSDIYNIIHIQCNDFLENILFQNSMSA